MIFDLPELYQVDVKCQLKILFFDNIFSPKLKITFSWRWVVSSY